MRDWKVAGGLIVNQEGLLLVRNRRRDGSHDWTPPGGVIEDHESTLAGLTREVAEETGVEVESWQGPVYEVVIEAPEMGWLCTVEAHVAKSFSGMLKVNDPDGIVVEAAWVAPAGCAGQLVGTPRWVREPVLCWLEDRDPAPWTQPRHTFRYHVAGRDQTTAVVTAL